MGDIGVMSNPMFDDPEDIDEHTAKWFRNVEQALGLRLLYWQKYYILYGETRMAGQTTAQVLRDLFHKKAPPPRDTNKRSSLYADEFRRIQTLLQTNGIE